MMPGGKAMANTWQGEFPWQNLFWTVMTEHRQLVSSRLMDTGFTNGGKIWEWTSDWYSDNRLAGKTKPCCGGSLRREATIEESFDPTQPQIKIPRKVIKGKSHLCRPQLLLAVPPRGRSPQMLDTSMSHLGFRCVVHPLGEREQT